MSGDSDLGKILRPSNIDPSDFVKGKIKNYQFHIEVRLLFHICYCCKYLDTSNGYLLEYRPCNCYTFYHGDCLEHWKTFQLQ